MAAVLRLQHTSIPMTADGHDEARRFFGHTLGMTEVLPPETLDREKLVWFIPGDGTQEIHVFVDEAMSHNSSGQHLCLQVENLATCRADLDAAGYLTEDTIAIQNRPRFFVKDHFGNLIEITEVTGEYE